MSGGTSGVQKAVTGVTKAVFVPNVSENKRPFTYNAEYQSSLPLQVLFYFNAWYAPFWLATSVVVLNLKYDRLSLLYQIVSVSMVVVMAAVEAMRLWLGYVGNLTERVPELAGSWLITCLLQLPLVLLAVFNDNAVLQPMERAASVVLLVFVALEAVVGFAAIRAMIRSQVKRFHRRQLAAPAHQLPAFDNPLFQESPPQ